MIVMRVYTSVTQIQTRLTIRIGKVLHQKDYFQCRVFSSSYQTILCHDHLIFSVFDLSKLPIRDLITSNQTKALEAAPVSLALHCELQNRKGILTCRRRTIVDHGRFLYFNHSLLNNFSVSFLSLPTIDQQNPNVKENQDFFSPEAKLVGMTQISLIP